MLIFPACPAKVKVFLNLIKYDKLKSYTGGRLPCSMIHKIKVVSFIPSIQLERGQVGPRTSSHVLEMRKICCPCQESNHGYPGHGLVYVVMRPIPVWGTKKIHNNKKVFPIQCSSKTKQHHFVLRTPGLAHLSS